LAENKDMQFVKNGPDVPDRLLQAHEDGRVVFFCGAGISYPAGLPGFAGLVTQLYADLTPGPNAVQQAAIDSAQFDTAIALLEAGLIGGREAVRRALARILTPKQGISHATATNEALLTLGQCRDGRTRLITTNFDRLFEDTIAAKRLRVPTFRAPLLPIPKNRWDGLVYLHGLLSPSPTASELDSLVVASGDFGLAYLTERWAARFVSELFRNYTVCFVGYSINDPVLRYMTDALAADRLLGESWPEMFVFGSYSKGKEQQRANEWRAKNVTPILYREHNRHAYLHRTLRVWAEIYRDGVSGKERIVTECAIARPLASTKQDDFVGRLLWALSESRGLAARRFAEMNPVPSLEWLEPFSDDRYRHADLSRFKVPPKGETDASLRFSLTQRPTPYDLAPRMALVGWATPSSDWDEVMRQLGVWLTRHLDDPKLLIWFVKSGAHLHREMIWMIERRLEEIATLNRDGKSEELARLRAAAPRAIPRPAMRTLWRLFLTKLIKARRRHFDLHDWRRHFARDGLTASLRMELRAALSPRISVREPFALPSEEPQRDGEEASVGDLVDWELELATEHVQSSLEDLPRDDRWNRALPNLLQDFESLLRDALDLKRELGDADDQRDGSYVHLPSISPHPQNKRFHDWTALVELTREAWLATLESDPHRALLVSQGWMHAPYPVFKRLGFFAAKYEQAVPASLALQWLLGGDGWWLWSPETERETMRLIVSLATRLSADELLQLVKAVLAGPPRSMFRRDIEDDHLARTVDRETWLRLAKIAGTGAQLPAHGAECFAALTSQYPEWSLAPDERDEFPFWMESGWVGNRDPWREQVSIPRTRRGTINYLHDHPEVEEGKQDDWRERCSTAFQATALALCSLAREGTWPENRWHEALQAWSDEKHQRQSWRFMGKVLSTTPDETLRSLMHPASYWLQSVSKQVGQQDEPLFVLVNRILNLDLPVSQDDDVVTRAINHPVGHLTEALLRWWYSRQLEDNQGLPERLKAVFSRLCEVTAAEFAAGRVLLAAHVIALFRVDPAWAETNLLPLFDWRRSVDEARATWEGFLWSPRLYRPLMEKLKVPFLEAARHYEQLGKHDGQYASLLTFAALEPNYVFTTGELANATQALPVDGLHESAQALVRSVESAGEQRADFWSNRVVPYLRRVWPNTRDHVSPTLAESLGQLCVAAQDHFPEALGLLRGWLSPPEHPDYVVHILATAGLCAKFPLEALEFLDLMISDSTQWLPRELRTCIDAIAAADGRLRSDPRYQRLLEVVRQRGQ
jgi:hypothetical protein